MIGRLAGFIVFGSLSLAASSYGFAHPLDRDPTLTTHARGVLPLIAALEAYKQAYGAYPDNKKPDEMEKLTPFLKGEFRWDTRTFRAQTGVKLWYYAGAKDRYDLAGKLGWDPSLVYSHTPQGALWFDMRGDGSDPEEPEPVILEP